MVTAVFSRYQFAVQISPHKGRRRFGGCARQDLDRRCLEERVCAPPHASGDYKANAAFLKPRWQEPWLVLRSSHLRRSYRFLRSRIDINQGELLAVPEVLGKSSVGNGNGQRI